MQNHIINVEYDNSNINVNLFKNIDYTLNNESFNELDDRGVPIIYNKLYKYLLNLPKDKRHVILSPNYAVSSSSIAAISEKYMTPDEHLDGNLKYTSPVQIIYITPITHLDELSELTAKDFSKSVLSNVLDENTISYTRHNFIPNPGNITLIGLNDYLLCTTQEEKMSTNGIIFFTISQIRKKGIEEVIDCIRQKVNKDPIHIIFDLSVMSVLFTPSVYRFVDTERDINKQLDGLFQEEIISIFDKLRNLNIVGLDITGYCFKSTTQEKHMTITLSSLQLAFQYLLDIKQKKINIFTPDTKFLIFRPIEQDSDDDIGWYILKGVDIDFEENVIERLQLLENEMEIFNLGDELVYISSTTIGEQKSKSYYTATDIKDRVLLPCEKDQMLFYLIIKESANTNKN
jgi:hypothetical protein